MDQHLVQGWHADPFGLHEHRYFSAGRPTKLVRDAGVEAYDEPPARDASADDVAVAASDPPADHATAATGIPSATNPGVPARRRRTGLVNIVVALVAVVAVVAFVVIEGGFSSKHQPKSAGSALPGTNLAAFITNGARSTLARKTADLTIRGTIDVGGNKAVLHGTGQTDLAADTVALHVSTSAGGIAEDEIVTGQAIYEQLSIGGQSFPQLLDGKHWFEIPLAGGSPTSTLQGSPAASLQVLEQQGATVTPLGTQDVGGRACSEYTVTPSEQAVLAAAQHEWAKLGLSGSDKAAAQRVLQNSPAPTYTVWFDPKTDLACQLDVSMQFGTGTGDQTGLGSAPSAVTAEVLVTFTHYGVPVHITVPAQSDTLSF